MPDGDPMIRAGNEITPNFNTPNVSTDNIFTQPKQPNKFMGVLKGIGSMAASFIPGVGPMIGNLIGGSGGGVDFGSMQRMIQQQQVQSAQMLQVQTQVSQQSQNFTSVSNLLKARHDATSQAISNFKS